MRNFLGISGWANSCYVNPLLLRALGAGTALADSPVEAQSAVWQPHHVAFNYFGITSRYTCDGMEGEVRAILMYLGARSDLSVRVQGCPRGGNSIGRAAWVTADFNTLVPGSTPASVTTTPAGWTPLKLQAARPFFMGDGELIDQMRKVLSDNFSWRGQVIISASCPPYSVQIDDYRVQGEVLKATPAPRS
jgi:hypothetical protein